MKFTGKEGDWLDGWLGVWRRHREKRGKLGEKLALPGRVVNKGRGTQTGATRAFQAEEVVAFIKPKPLECMVCRGSCVAWFSGQEKLLSLMVTGS